MPDDKYKHLNLFKPTYLPKNQGWLADLAVLKYLRSDFFFHRLKIFYHLNNSLTNTCYH